MTMTTIEECAAIARERWYIATPYRVGIVAGEMGLRDDLCPYDEGSRGRALYFEGVRYAREKAARGE
jgi:hypothetical protein